jgi:hypothetical protein
LSIFGHGDIYRPDGSLPAKPRATPAPEALARAIKQPDSFKLMRQEIIANFKAQEALKSQVNVYESGVYWEFPDVPFRSIYEYYKRDPGIQSAVNSRRKKIIGSGFYFTADDGKVVDFLSDWKTDNNIEQKLNVIIGDAVLLGTGLGEILHSGQYFDIVPVDMRTIVAVKRDQFGNIQHYIQQTLRQTYVDLDPNNFIRFAYNDVGRQAWPLGICHSLVVPFFEFEGEPWSMADGIALMRQDYLRIIHKQAAPRIWHIYENAGEEALKQQALKDKEMKPGERGYTDAPFTIQQEQVDGTARFREYIEFVTNAFENGLEAPTAKIMTAAGISNATYASAEAAEEMYDQDILMDQRKWKMQIEQQMLKPLLAANGMDLVVSKAELNWGLPDPPNIDINQILSLVTAGIVQRAEAREILKNYARVPLSEQETQLQKAEAREKFQQAIKNLKNINALARLTEKSQTRRKRAE